MIVELIEDDVYGPDGPQLGAQGAVIGTHKDTDSGEKYYSVAFPGFTERGFFFCWESNVKVIKKK